MKIISEGKPWSLKVKCTGNGWEGSGCKATLELDEDDVFESSHTDMAGDTEYFFSFECPICGQRTDVNESRLTERVKMKAKGLYRNREFDSWR